MVACCPVLVITALAAHAVFSKKKKKKKAVEAVEKCMHAWIISRRAESSWQKYATK
jgi:hypothetical protein